MDHQLPSSSSSARIDVEVREPWQLVARGGAGWLAVGLTMPAVLTLLQTLSLIALTDASINWDAVIVTIRIGRAVTGVIALVGVWRLLRAPLFDRQHRLLVFLLFFASAIASPVLASDERAGSLMAVIFACASWVTLIEALRTIDRAADDDGRPQGLWRVLTVVAVVSAVINHIAPRAEPMLLLSTVLSFARLALIGVCFTALRRKLC